jgi:hypothetical protein
MRKNYQHNNGGFMKEKPKKYAYPIDPVRKKRIDEMGKKHNKSIKQILDRALDNYLEILEKTDPV